MSWVVATVAGALLLSTPPLALAQQGTGSAASSNATSLSPAEVVRKIEAAGYRDVRDVEYDNGHWEAEAIDKNGRRVDLRIDPSTGAVVLDED